MANKPVTIGIAGGELTYDYPNRRLTMADSISWICPNRFFAIQFFGISPLDVGEIQAFNQTQQVSVRAGAAPGSYTYACAVYDDGTKQVYLDAACPAIIIQR